MSGSQFFNAAAGSDDKTLKLYAGHFHDLLNDLGKEAVMADIEAWICNHLPKGSAPSINTHKEPSHDTSAETTTRPR